MSVTIPSPPTLPLVGSLFELDGKAVIQSLVRMANELGPIYRLRTLGPSALVLSGHALVDEVCDESRFGKFVHSALKHLRPALGDGLFTAESNEPNWELAHRILMPAFGPLGIRDMFDRMYDIAGQMFDKWERFGDSPINVPDTMTRLTLDTIALCAFDFRFNSFYREEMHPFVDAMVGTLVEAGARDRRPAFVTHAMFSKRQAFERDIALMHSMADELLNSRKAEGEAGRRGDILDIMIAGIDPVSGKQLTDENIRFQLATFLIAGHETTSGLLSFAVYLLLEHPEEMARARACVDAILGDRKPTLDDMASLEFIDHVMMETLRLWPTAPAFAVTPHKPTTLAGRHPVEPGDPLLVLLPALHRDRSIWGDDANCFRPARFAGDAAQSLPKNAWKPFGNGARACIGRGFALQEAKLVLSMMLQRFEIQYAKPGYELSICETLTIKPDGLEIIARRRTDKQNCRNPDTAFNDEQAPVQAVSPVAHPLSDDGRGEIIVLHGGNSGSCASFARRIQADAVRLGFSARLLNMDEAVGIIPANAILIVVAASYEGLPANNARKFMSWIEGLEEDSLNGLRYGVLGCGNRQWVRTYQAVPKRIDTGLANAGATRFIDRGQADAAGDFLRDADIWIEGVWSSLNAAMPSDPGSHHSGITELPSRRRPDSGEIALLKCERNVRLTSPGSDSVKCDLNLRILNGVPYRSGDYLAVVPSNPASVVTRVLRHLAIDMDTRIAVHEGHPLYCVLGAEPVPVKLILSDYVDLDQPVTAAQVELFAQRVKCPQDRDLVRTFVGQHSAEHKPRTMDLLDRLPSCEIEIEELLAVLPPMVPRQYSIASSPLKNPDRVSLTVSVANAPGILGGQHFGAASNFLADMSNGVTLSAAIIPGLPHFALPDDLRTPIIMICAGSGIAPFKGFIEERQIRHERGETAGPALLYFGCRSPDTDWLYRDELLAWQERGIIDLRMAFSREPAGDVRYVQDRLKLDANVIGALVAQGAKIFVCGGANTLVPGVEAALCEIASQRMKCSFDVAERWARRYLVGTGRYAVDAFA